jgi:hypothetical protein
VVVALVLGSPSALSQEETASPEVRLTLIRQTAFANGDRPFRASTRVTNTGAEPLEELSLSLTVYHPARSRTAYGVGLTGEPPTAPLLVETVEVAGTIAPSGSRDISIERSLPELTARRENALYPVKLQLEAAGVPLAAVRSALIFIFEEPLVPLNVSLAFVLDEPVHVRPDGAFADEGLAESIAQGGRIDTIVSSLEAAPIRATMVISPLLLTQLERMRDGYQVVEGAATRTVPADAPEATRASAMLARIRQLARRPTTEVIPLPYAAPTVPSLVTAGLDEDLARQIDVGRREVERFLSVPSSTRLFRPPGAQLTDQSLDVLAGLGFEILLADADTLLVPEGLILSPSATALVTSRGGATLEAIAPDPGLAARVESLPPGAPRLGAQWLVGELSALYFEQPSVVRGAAIVFDPPTPLAPRFVEPFLTAMENIAAKGRWLRPVKATALAAAVAPEEVRGLARSHYPTFTPAFVAELGLARSAVTTFDGMAAESALAERLRINLLIAEARQFVADETAGIRFLRAVGERIDQELAKIEPPAATAVTLTSRGGVIPLTIRNLAGYPLRVRVSLLSPRLEFLEGASREILLERPTQSFTFPVRAQTTGRFPVVVVIESPDGTRLVAESQILVRSTAYNRAALGLTIGAAVFLAFWWGRRFLRRRTS